MDVMDTYGGIIDEKSIPGDRVGVPVGSIAKDIPISRQSPAKIILVLILFKLFSYLSLVCGSVCRYEWFHPKRIIVMKLIHPMVKLTTSLLILLNDRRALLRSYNQRPHPFLGERNILATLSSRW